MKRKNIPHSPRLVEFKKKRHAAVRRRVFLAIFLLAGIIVGLGFVAGWNKVNITDIEISGNKVVDTEAMRAVIDQSMTGKYAWIVPKTNFLFYPKKDILQNLARNFKRLKDISASINGANALQLKVTERAAQYTWCGADKMELTESDTPCYFLDQSGYVIDKAPYFSGDVYFRLYGAITLSDEEKEDGGASPLGGYYFKDYFTKLIAFKDTSAKIGLKPIALYTGDDGEIKMYVENGATRKNPAILLRTDSDFEKIAENLHTALNTDPLKSKFAKNYSGLEYIDLRFGNKVYFKFTGDAAPAPKE